ncbi:hypothetical protein Y1Q_0013728 [Alligator mississippiensis]|uniref:Uncharacterized protein n=1 Tax=Alligator mississippiensis TaxID=8496 RepID=A0A151NVQ5_ALLMI|nr:hypothetical protein Y1Q_0013728 [Alligator mississippiensis]
MHLVPLRLFPRTSTDIEAEEVEGQEETHASNMSSTVIKIQKQAGPWKSLVICLLPQPGNSQLARAVAAVDLFPNHRDPWLPGTASCLHYSRALQRFSQQAEMVL